jgi:hypothetical protein
MMRINGKDHPTITDAAPDLGGGVTPKTVQMWIRKGIIPPPPIIEQGTRKIQVFPPEYMKRAKEQLAKYNEQKDARRNKNGATLAD